jgi:hypothetical protein
MNIDTSGKQLDATGLMMAKKYLEHTIRTGEKAEVSEFAKTMQMKMTAARKLLLAAQDALGKTNLI